MQNASAKAVADTAQHRTAVEPHPSMTVFYGRNRGNFKPRPARHRARARRLHHIWAGNLLRSGVWPIMRREGEQMSQRSSRSV